MGGWVLAKKVEREIEKCGRMWQEDFLLLILCDFVYMCIYKGYRRIPSYSLDLVPFLKMIELFKVVSFEGIFRYILLRRVGRKIFILWKIRQISVFQEKDARKKKREEQNFQYDCINLAIYFLRNGKIAVFSKILDLERPDDYSSGYRKRMQERIGRQEVLKKFSFIFEKYDYSQKKARKNRRTGGLENENNFLFQQIRRQCNKHDSYIIPLFSLIKRSLR